MPKQIIVLIAVLFAGLNFTFAGEYPARMEKKTVTFSYMSRYSAYHCDYVESQAKAALAALGAQDVSVRCTGGLPYDTANFVTAKFYAVELTDEDKATKRASEESVQLKFRESCDFNEKLVDQLLKGFEVTKVKKNSSCWNSQGRVSYDITVLQ